MSLAFRIAVAPAGPARAAVVLPQLIGALGVVLSALQLAGAAGAPLAFGLAVPALALLAWSSRRALRGCATGELRVDARGTAQWWPSGALDASGLEPLRWRALGPLVWLEGRCAGRRLSLLWATAGTAEADRARLLAWLGWLDRAGKAGDPLRRVASPPPGAR